MLEIVICEDNEVYLHTLIRDINEIILESSINGSIVFQTSSPSAVEDYLKQGTANMFLLDIDLDTTVTGFDLAKKIRKNNSRAYIVFITEHLEYMLQSFKVRPFDFLPKPATRNILKQCLLEVCKDHNDRNIQSATLEEHITVKFATTQYYIKKQEIIFIEKFGNRSIIHTQDKIITCYESLESLEAKLHAVGTFIRCHKSYLVNKMFFAEVRFNTMEIMFTTGQKCYIGKKYRKALESGIKG